MPSLCFQPLQQGLPGQCLLALEQMPAAESWRKLVCMNELTLTSFHSFSQGDCAGVSPVDLEVYPSELFGVMSVRMQPVLHLCQHSQTWLKGTQHCVLNTCSFPPVDKAASGVSVITCCFVVVNSLTQFILAWRYSEGAVQRQAWWQIAGAVAPWRCGAFSPYHTIECCSALSWQ